MEQKIVVQHLSLSYGPKKALDDVSLDVPTGQIMALIGPSGCGKSTLLRSMNRMHDLNHNVRIEGSILLDGRDIYAPHTDVVAIRRQIGMVFQQPNPFPKSIFDNVAYGLRINGLTGKQKLAEAVEQSLRSSSLWDEVKDVLDRSALSLSGGQQQRLCIARTIAVQPEVILMDEPCSALDPISTGKVEELMRELKKNYTLIVVTHNMAQAQRVADLTTMMYDGHIIETAPTKRLFEQPEEDVTKNYVQGHFG